MKGLLGTWPLWSSWKMIIAMKGLPSTGKSELAGLLGQWARCKVLYIDDFLDTPSLERGEEAQRLHRLALETLYRAALRHIRYSERGVVIKSRLCSAFELDLLIRLVNDIDDELINRNRCAIIVIIIDCQMKNEFRQHARLEDGLEQRRYKARSWKDDDDCSLDSQAWEYHLLSKLNHNISRPVFCTRLVLEPFDDLYFSQYYCLSELTPDFLDAIQHVRRQELYRSRGGYKTVQYDELRRDLFEKKLQTPRKRSKHVCTSTTNKGASCVFKYYEALPASDECCCGACGKQVVSGQPAYTCHFCILTFHKSCADQKLDFGYLTQEYVHTYHSYSDDLYDRHDEKNACKSCRERGEKYFSEGCESCVFEAHLKSGCLPTIINHDSHHLHFLSMQFAPDHKTCKACGFNSFGGRYVCQICNYFYHPKCVFMPGEVKHEHGGYEHVMKLMYTHEGMDQEDDHWCNICYNDMNPQAWFYACQDCPYYVTHAYESCVGKGRVREALSNGKFSIRQMRNKLKVDETN